MPNGGGQPSGPNTSKMVEEIKLFWTIQTAVGGLLAFLGTNLTLAAYTGAASMQGITAACASAAGPALASACLASIQAAVASGAAKDVAVCAVAFLPLVIGSVYNITANYYIRIEGSRADRGSSQESITTLFIALSYLVLATGLGLLAGESLAATSMLTTSMVDLIWWVPGALIYIASGTAHAAVYFIEPKQPSRPGAISIDLDAARAHQQAYRDYTRVLVVLFFPFWVFRYVLGAKRGRGEQEDGS